MKDRYFVYCKKCDIAQEVIDVDVYHCGKCGKPMAIKNMSNKDAIKFDIKEQK